MTIKPDRWIKEMARKRFYGVRTRAIEMATLKMECK